MYIGVDGRPLQGETQYRGIGKALGLMLESLVSQLSRDDTLVFYLDSGLPKPELLKKIRGYKTIWLPTSKLGRKRYWRSILSSYPPIKPGSGDIDVLLQYDASLGVPTSVPTVVVFHDLIPLLFREQEKRKSAKGLRRVKNALASNLYWRKYIRTLNNYKRARMILPLSEASKRDLLKHLSRIDPDKVKVVHLGVNKPDKAAAGSAAVRKLTSRPYLLYVGGIDFRKNIIELLKAFYELKPKYPDLRLITVGKEFSLNNQLSDLGWYTVLNSNKTFAKDVIAPGFLTEEDLIFIYQHAEAFVFPSRYEGFGLPIIEAMQIGVPVVAYKNSSIPEVAGNAAMLVKDGDPLAPAIEQLLSNKALRRTLINKGRQQAKQFSWHETAKHTLAALKKAAKNE